MNASVAIPALRQSLVETMSCPKSYEFQVIQGKKMPGGAQSARGTEIHSVMSRYIKHCAKRMVEADWAEFDKLAAGAGPEAAEILNGLRDNYVVDYEHVYDTELTLTIEDELIALEGTLDVLLLLSEFEAKIPDFKSHPRPFDADTFQGKLYSVFVFLLFPKIERITFELIFVRYANCSRSVVYTRDDLPRLREEVLNARRRQEAIHGRYDAGQPNDAIPGSHCQYCPMLQKPNACPISEFNPEANTNIEDWARFVVWSDNARAVALQALKNRIDATGVPIEFADGNGRKTQFNYREHPSVQFPMLKTLPFLFEHRDTYEGDVDWIGNLMISSTKLKSYLKAKKRAITHQAIMDNAAEPVTKVKFEYALPAETDEADAKREPWEEE